MKIAYVFHGHARTWEKCHQAFFDNVFSVAPGDIFMHTWHTTNASVGSHWNTWSDLDDELLKKSSELIDTSAIHRTYKPKLLMIEEDLGVDETGYQPHPRMKAYLGGKNMLNGARKVFVQAMSYDKYDRVFSTRMDILYENKLDINELSDPLLICHNHSYPDNIAFDLWMHGTPNDIDIKSQYLYFYDQMFLNNPNLGMLWYEPVFSHYLSERGIKFKKSSLNCCIPRITGEISRI